MINSDQDYMLRVDNVQDPSHVIWHLLGIVGLYDRWDGKAVRATF